MLAADHGSLELGIAARLEGDSIACGYMSVVVADIIAVGMAFSLADAGHDAGARAALVAVALAFAGAEGDRNAEATDSGTVFCY